MDYEKMWQQMIEDMENLVMEGVQNIHPKLVMSFMHYIYKVEATEQEVRR